MLEHAVTLGRANLGEDDPGVLAAAHHLARLHQFDDDPSGARRVLEEAYAAGQWRLGDSDPLMLEISFDLGVVAEELGNRHEARKALGRVVELGEPVLGGGHWAVLKAKAYLAGNHGAIAHSAPVPEAPVQESRPRDVASLVAPRPASSEPMIPQQGGTPLVRRVPGAQTPPLPEEYPQVTIPPRPEPAPPVQAPPVPPVIPVQQAPVESWDGWPAEQAPVQQQPEPYRPFDDLAVHRPFADPQPPRITATPDVALAPVPSRRGPAIFAAIAAVLAVSVAVVALVFVLADRGDKGDGKDSDVPTVGGGPPPKGVQVRDYGTSVEISWIDASGGRTSTLITAARAGEQFKPMGEVAPGVTRFELRGLNDQLNYCFAVVSVYGVDTFSPSEQSCTSRPGPGKTG